MKNRSGMRVKVRKIVKEYMHYSYYLTTRLATGRRLNK